MSGRQGYKGWRWVFILEGVLTCVVAIIFFFVLPDFPEDSKWVNDEERIYIKARLQADQGRSAAERKITLRDVGRVFRDFKVWIGGVCIALFQLQRASLNIDFFPVHVLWNDCASLWLRIFCSGYHPRIRLRCNSDTTTFGKPTSQICVLLESYIV